MNVHSQLVNNPRDARAVFIVTWRGFRPIVDGKILLVEIATRIIYDVLTEAVLD